MARANDSAFVGVGGSLQPMRGEHPALRMVRESIKIEVFPTHYRAQVDFTFENNGPRTEVTMGFPENGTGDIGTERYLRRPGFSRFNTWVDGRRVRARRVAKATAELMYEAHWLKTVRFAGGQRRRIRVSYEAPLATYIAGSAVVNCVPYDFTGGNWHGRVDASDIHVGLHLGGTYLTCASIGGKEFLMRRRKNRFVYRWTNWQAQGEFRFSFVRTVPQWLVFQGSSFPLSNDLKVLQQVDLKGSPATGPAVWYPPVMLRKGVAYVALSELYRAMDSRMSNRKIRSGAVTKHWDAQDHLAWLNYGKESVQFFAGKRFFMATYKSGMAGQMIQSPASFLLHGSLYVPFAAPMRTLHITVKVQPQLHLASFTLPGIPD